MEERSRHSAEESHPFSHVVKEVTESLSSVIRSEIHIAKAELREIGAYLARYGSRMAIFAIFATLGILPFLSFLVIGLGRLLNENYWLSSLLVAAFMFLVGGVAAYAMYKRIKQAKLRFENTRETLTTQLKTVERKLHEVTDTAKAKATRRPAS